MSVELKGYILNQRQLDAIVPVMNLLMRGKVKQKGFEDACIKALEVAGCPVGYDITMPGSEKSVAERAQAWLLDGRVGMSAKAIYCHMTGNTDKDRWNHPHDPDDLNRCLLLLDLIPEWKERMLEMKMRSPAWAGLAVKWEEISQSFFDEAGLDWCKGKSAPKTYAIMEQAIGNYEEPGVFRIRL